MSAYIPTDLYPPKVGLAYLLIHWARDLESGMVMVTGEGSFKTGRTLQPLEKALYNEALQTIHEYLAGPGPLTEETEHVAPSTTG